MIRLMSIDDYDEVFELWINTKGMGLRSLDDSIEGIIHFLERNPSTNYVSVVDNKIVGIILSGNDVRRGYIYNTVVDEKYREIKWLIYNKEFHNESKFFRNKRLLERRCRFSRNNYK